MGFLFRSGISLFLTYTLTASSQLVPNEIPGCQYPSLTSSTYIYFTDPSDSKFAFSIKTGWTDTYDDILRQAITASGFNLSAGYNPSDSMSLCSWVNLGSVVVKGLHRGDISYREFPYTKPYRVPSNETMTRIRNILLDNSPDHDFSILMLTICLPIATIGVMYALAYWLLIRKVNPSTSSPDMELESMDYRRNSDLASPEKPNPFQTISSPPMPKEIKRRDSGPSPLSKVYSVKSASSSQYSEDYRASSIKAGENYSISNVSL